MPLRSTVLILTCLSFYSNPCLADLVSQVTAAVDGPTSGAFSYSYTVKDSTTSSEDIFAFSLFHVGPLLDGSVITPAGWFADTSSGSVTWSSNDSTFDVDPGGSILFGFKSMGSPGKLAFLLAGSDSVSGDPTGDAVSGSTTGPEVVPEPPSAMVSIPMLACLITARQWLSRARNHRVDPSAK
jgi:hypothetical protein